MNLKTQKLITIACFCCTIACGVVGVSGMVTGSVNYNKNDRLLEINSVDMTMLATEIKSSPVYIDWLSKQKSQLSNQLSFGVINKDEYRAKIQEITSDKFVTYNAKKFTDNNSYLTIAEELSERDEKYTEQKENYDKIRGLSAITTTISAPGMAVTGYAVSKADEEKKAAEEKAIIDELSRQ